MSSYIEVYGIKYKLPAKPEVIDNVDLEKEDQKFYKTEAPDIFDELEFDEDGSPIYSDEQRDFIIQEWRRINDGYWFLNNGQVTYITGLHYFYLNYRFQIAWKATQN